MVGVGKVGAGDDAAVLNAEPTEDVFVGDGVEAGGGAVVNIDQTAGATGGGGLLHGGIEWRGGGDDFVEKLAEDGVDVEASIVTNLADDGLPREAGEMGDLLIGEKGEDGNAAAAVFDFEDSHFGDRILI